MNIVNKLTLRHLGENKRRTVITTFGICVSVAMITAVFVAVASFMNLFGEIELISGGYKHAVFETNSSQIQQLKSDERIAKVGVRCNPEAQSFQLENKSSLTNGTGSVYIGDSTNLKQMFTGKYEGTIPKNEHEIAVEQSLIEDNNLDWEIGDTVSFPTGIRYIEEDGVKSEIVGSYVYGEEFEEIKTDEYTITAILHTNPATAARYSIIEGFDSSNLEDADGTTYSSYIELAEINRNSLDTLNSITEKYDISEYEYNNNYLETEFVFSENSTLAAQILPLAAIILVIIMIASVVLIYNAFAMSLSERVRYLGMLSSVGATKAQKKASVYFEGFILGAIGIPLGIAGGIVGIAITLKALGKRIISTGMILGVSDSDMSMKVIVPLWAVIGIIVFSVLTILISSFIPSQKASSITPINAIKQSSEIKLKAKKLKTPKIVKKVFGYEGELAYKNLKRNGRKSRVITASIALSVILFLSCNYFCEMFTQSVQIEASVPYQISVNVSYDDKDRLIESVKQIPDVDNYYCINNYMLEYDKNSKNSFAGEACLTSEYRKLFDIDRYAVLNVIDDEAFNKLCRNNNVDYSGYYGSHPEVVILNNIDHQNTSARVFNEKVIGKAIDFNGTEIIISALAEYDSENYVCGLNPPQTISFYMPESSYTKFFPDEASTYFLGVETDVHTQAAEELNSALQEGDFRLSSVHDIDEALQVMNTLTFIIEVLVYGFIALITLITAANILNTISTSIDLRRKEFAMLKSVGTTPKGFKKMICLESLLYALKALVFALPVSVLISFGMNRAISSSGIYPFRIDFIVYALVILAVFLIVVLSMLYGVTKVKDNSIVETLKEEIC